MSSSPSDSGRAAARSSSSTTAATVRETPIATRTALAQTLKRVGSLMKQDEDVLFLFLTSHGSKDGRFSLSFPPLRLNDLTPTELKAMLDEAGIRNRVIVVSSCYSGAFIEALRDDDTMIMTASARDRNSFGCSNEADFTYFGKAYFDEALRATDSFSEAFDRALPVIAEREKKEDYEPSDAAAARRRADRADPRRVAAARGTGGPGSSASRTSKSRSIHRRQPAGSSRASPPRTVRRDRLRLSNLSQRG